ncbi:four helix bundle protein [Nostoc ellipsosporum NOK]|jgi:four helix bundle protein|nr:four helix bundle protein [Nostoc ellipsosporum NOK]
MRNDRQNLIVDKTVKFSVKMISFCETLKHSGKDVIARQLLKSSTAIGANVFEAQNAESVADFIHKMKIAAKEATETLYWLTLCEKSETCQFDKQYMQDAVEIGKILSKIIATSKKQHNQCER